MATATAALGMLPIVVTLLLLASGIDLFAELPYLIYIVPMVGGMLSVIFAFTIRLTVEVVPMGRFTTIAGLAKAFRLAGFTVAERTATVTVTFDKWTAVRLSFNEGGDARLVYRLDATSTSLSVILILFLLGLSAVIAIPFCVFLLVRTHANARAYAPWVLSGDFDMLARPGTTQASRDIRENLLDSLSEVRRVANDAYWSMRTASEDAAVLSITILGLVGGLILFAILLQTSVFDPYYRAAASLLTGLGIALITSILLAIWISRPMKPKLGELDTWVKRIDRALLRERADDQQEGSESSIELLFGAFNEMPNFLHARRKAVLSRYPATQILVLILVLWGSSFIVLGSSVFYGALMYLIPLAVGLAMVSAAFLLYRWSLRKESAEEAYIAKEWERRRDYLRSAVEEQLGRM